VLVRPTVPQQRYGWLSLLAGAAMTDAVRFVGGAAELKWPNDVLLGGRKVCGILAEVLPDGSGVVVGAGLNHRIPADALPVPTATSLAAVGLPSDPDAVVTAYLDRLFALLDAFEGAGGDPERSGLRAAVERVCATIGSAVRVELPDGGVETGRATGLDDDGRLIVARDRDPSPLVVAAGDVTHLRYQ
jgi:BirA family biotin operon repressor/biotin-[acetyl-CoA-carboxylase] ligase